MEKLCSAVLLACPTGLGNIKCHQVCTTISQKNIFKVAKQLGKLESDKLPEWIFCCGATFLATIGQEPRYNNPRGATATTIKKRRTKNELRQKAKRQRKQKPNRKPKDDASFPFLGGFFWTDFWLTVNHIWQTC